MFISFFISGVLKMYLKSYLKDNKALFEKKWLLFFIHRVNYSISILSHKKSIRKVDTPSYLNDLGLRKFKEQNNIYNSLVNKNILTKINIKKLDLEFKNLPVNDIAIWLDAFALCIGNYDLLYDFIQKRYSEILNSEKYDLLIYSGTIMGIFEDNRAIDLFNSAIKSTDNKENQAIALHRELVFRIKRMKGGNSILQKFNELFLKVNELGPLERLRVMALADNLYGLYVIEEEIDYEVKNNFASTILNNAQILLKQYVSIATDKVKIDEAYRYLSQVNINQAQLMVGVNNFEAAEKILVKNLSFASKFATDYIPEARAALSYVYYLENKLDLSIANAKKAINEFDHLGFYESSNTVKQILVAAYYKSNKESEAKKVWKDINN